MSNYTIRNRNPILYEKGYKDLGLHLGIQQWAVLENTVCIYYITLQ